MTKHTTPGTSLCTDNGPITLAPAQPQRALQFVESCQENSEISKCGKNVGDLTRGTGSGSVTDASLTDGLNVIASTVQVNLWR
jgi:hypothetical protein